MDFENASFASSSSSSSPCTTPSPSTSPSQIASHKRKAGRKKFQETRHPLFRGVRRRNGNKWVCEVREPNKKSRIWLGTYPTPEMAARAHDVAALALRGGSAALNFPDLASLLPTATSSSAKDIRAAAAKAADAFRSTGSSSSMPSSSHVQNISNTSSEKISNDEESRWLFLDEEALYNMPGLLDHMAEGLLLSPPSVKRALDWDDNFTCQIDLTLWRDD